MKELYHKFERICDNCWFPVIFIPIAICFLLLYSFTTSPLFLNDGMDSAVFKTMGLAILKGKIPYMDIFDHKGPILYFINAIGQWFIHGRLGIFVLQVLGLSVALVYLNKMAKLFVNNVLSFLSVLVVLIIYGCVIQEGNQCEEWMMYFFTIALYYVFYYCVKLKNKPHPLKYSILYGLCFGTTFFIRPNDAVAIMGGMMMGLVIWMIRKNELKNVVNNTLCFIAGFLFVALPVFAYFAYHHGTSDMLYGLIGFNKSYTGNGIQLLISVLTSKKTALALVFICLVLLVFETKEYRIILVILIPVLLLEWILMGANFFPHYYIVLLPIYLIYVVFIILQLLKKEKNRSLIVLSIGILFLSAHISNRSIMSRSLYCLKERLETFTHGQAYNSIKDLYAETDALLSLVPVEECDSIWNYNLKWVGPGVSDCSLFSSLWHHGIVQCNLITYGSNEELKKKDDITEKKPLWVVFDDNKTDQDYEEENDAYFSENYYLVARTDTAVCNVVLYKRK